MIVIIGLIKLLIKWEANIDIVEKILQQKIEFIDKHY